MINAKNVWKDYQERISTKNADFRRMGHNFCVPVTVVRVRKQVLYVFFFYKNQELFERIAYELGKIIIVFLEIFPKKKTY
jgi:hypothetical protein